MCQRGTSTDCAASRSSKVFTSTDPGVSRSGSTTDKLLLPTRKRLRKPSALRRLGLAVDAPGHSLLAHPAKSPSPDRFDGWATEICLLVQFRSNLQPGRFGLIIWCSTERAVEPIPSSRTMDALRASAERKGGRRSSTGHSRRGSYRSHSFCRDCDRRVPHNFRQS